jgi:mono/diheme cytochrome c family protein
VSSRTASRVSYALAAVTLAALASGCRGQPSEEPPIHLIGDMDWQPKVRPEYASSFFADRRAMRPLVEGTLAQGTLDEDDDYYRGGSPEAAIAVAPVEMSEKLLARGEERFNIYCSVCHDKAGTGHGMVVQRGYPIPVDLSSERVRTMKDGEIFRTISNGVRNMPAYRAQIPPGDRWAIVTWVRVIGRSQYATLADVPGEMRNRIAPKETTP